jgi:molecular chaperone DnaJ
MEEIKKAYRNYAFVYHPDRNIDSRDGDAEFQDVARAYGILKESCGNGRLFGAEDGTSNRFVVRVRE